MSGLIFYGSRYIRFWTCYWKGIWQAFICTITCEWTPLKGQCHDLSYSYHPHLNVSKKEISVFSLRCWHQWTINRSIQPLHFKPETVYVSKIKRLTFQFLLKIILWISAKPCIDTKINSMSQKSSWEGNSTHVHLPVQTRVSLPS